MARQEMGMNARKAMQLYAEDKVAQQWKDLIGSFNE
ncbi:hypothetical protein QE441_003780 [Chryseobacterium sp. SORGH_AS909]|uniref:Uncharacterized protein n=1 Tax=Chryseobacterium camelliae TaxID=1265445 RepID=A0ABU0TI22_9FLAO|nr:hypothetical protein [Chryseobacterium camelliae]MDQ1100648.1 hypothetical protein [Chryseobacterium sp. SORGH_AS_1048]MDR6087986.1 hypothetical protein [Chryseobacterium sp. SORGH_AS_0909]MDR6132361.1 hypothetical protein [Chryseobacterium sp. SORGH_AS_1175]MDT3409431.1 hypothetical protein [Pseudacidovorax intermedius]